ncbi:hypothetical protein MMC27_007909 [Xylographa pallens]|nr:hypothetical protein [Xylographa pallens]
MTLPEKRPAESPANADGKIKRPKLNDDKESQQHPLVINHISSTVLIRNFPIGSDQWSIITREPRIGEGLICMTISVFSVSIRYKSPTYAEAMLYRSAKGLSDLYGLSVCLENSASTDVPKPRNEVVPLTGLVGSASTRDTQRPLVPPPFSTNLFADSPYVNAPKLFGSTLPAGTSFGLRPATGAFGTSNVGPSTSSPFADLFGSGAASLKARSKPDESTQPSFTSRDMFGFPTVPHVSRPAENTVSPSSTQPWFGLGGFGATSPLNIPQPIENHTPPTSIFSSPNPAASTRRTEHLKPYNVNPSSAPPSASSLERDPQPYAYTPSPTLQAGQTCTRCKVVHLQRGVCDCDRSPPPSNIFGKRTGRETKPVVRVKLPRALSVSEGLKDSKKRSKAFHATCEDFDGEEGR